MAIIKSRKKMKSSNFIFPKDKRYPIQDISHARNALARSSGKPEEAKVKSAVYARYPSLRPSAKACAKMSDIGLGGPGSGRTGGGSGSGFSKGKSIKQLKRRKAYLERKLKKIKSASKPHSYTIAEMTKYNKLNTSDLKMNDIIIHLSDQVLAEMGKWYKVLNSGEFYSRKFSGIWDADPKVYMNEIKAGKVKVNENFVQSLYDNYKNNVNETQLFMDEDHDQTISFGPIKDMKIEMVDGQLTLFVMPEWNDLGIDAVKNKHYMYLSVSIEHHIHSKTGIDYFPVVTTTSLTNIPVKKDQDILELSDKSIPAGKKIDKSKNKKGGSSMGIDAILEKIAELKEMISTAVEGDSGTVAKAAIGAAIDELEISCGLATEEEEAGEGEKEEPEQLADGTPNPKFKPKAPATPPAVGTPAPAQMSDHPEFLQLSEQNKTLAAQVQALQLKDKDNSFTQSYVGKKITPAQKSQYFALYLKDEKAVSEILKGMPDLNLSQTLGHSADIQLSDVTPENARQIFDLKVLELKDKEKIGPLEAAEKIRMSDKKLYDLAYPGHKQ